jgi:RNA polymerase subunit RPABC4/transcription elongation factor Spt4
MRARSRDPFAQLLAAVVVAVLPGAGLLVYIILRPPETLAEAYERALEEEALLQEIEERPACPGCSRTVDSRWILCPHCHTRLRKICPDCNSLMELQWNLCPFCGNQHVDLYQAGPPFVSEGAIRPDLMSVLEESDGQDSVELSPVERGSIERGPFERGSADQSSAEQTKAAEPQIAEGADSEADSG